MLTTGYSAIGNAIHNQSNMSKSFQWCWSIAEALACICSNTIRRYIFASAWVIFAASSWWLRLHGQTEWAENMFKNVTNQFQILTSVR